LLTISSPDPVLSPKPAVKCLQGKVLVGLTLKLHLSHPVGKPHRVFTISFSSLLFLHMLFLVDSRSHSLWLFTSPCTLGLSFPMTQAPQSHFLSFGTKETRWLLSAFPFCELTGAHTGLAMKDTAASAAFHSPSPTLYD
jgi:hypothetical protein